MLMFVIKNHLPSDLLADDLERLKYLLMSAINNCLKMWIAFTEKCS